MTNPKRLGWAIHFLCAVGASSILLERSSRSPEFGMNLCSRFVESVPKYLNKQRLWYDMPMGNNLLLLFSFGAISWVYFTYPEAIKPTFRKFIGQLFGPPNIFEKKEDKEIKEYK